METVTNRPNNATVRTFECRSLEQALGILGKREHVKVCNNTTIWRTESGATLFLHGHPIVRFLEHNTIFNSCGYRTVTTKQRINRCTPPRFSLFQRNWDWYWFDAKDTENNPIFQNGDTLSTLG